MISKKPFLDIWLDGMPCSALNQIAEIGERSPLIEGEDKWVCQGGASKHRNSQKLPKYNNLSGSKIC